MLRQSKCLAFALALLPRLPLAWRVTVDDSLPELASPILLKFRLPPKTKLAQSSFIEAEEGRRSAKLEPSEPDTINIQDFQQEYEQFLKFKDIEEFYGKKTKLFNMRSEGNKQAVPTALEKLRQIKETAVPGLQNKETFADVFEGLKTGGCPVWLLGGAVRDLLSGKEPADVDAVVFCHVSEVSGIATRKGWRHFTQDQFYWSVGFHESDNAMSDQSVATLEGSRAAACFGRHPADLEFSATSLLWAVSADVVVDPTGQGVEDAMNSIIRPAYDLGGGERWEGLKEWLHLGFGDPSHARHVRYLKLRMRGWKPVDECFRLFMANAIEASVLVERPVKGEPETPVALFNEVWLLKAGFEQATLHFLAKKYGDDEDGLTDAVRTLYKVYEEDMQLYFNELEPSKKLACNQPKLAMEYDNVKTKGVTDFAMPRNIRDFFRKGIYDQCQNEAEDDFWNECPSVVEVGDEFIKD